MVIIGEVHTGLLRHGGALSVDQVDEALQLLPGKPVRHSARPSSYARSAERCDGLDCTLTTAKSGVARGVGTAVSTAVALGGRLVQGSTYATLRRAEHGMRRPWSHYLARPGEIEIIGKCDLVDLADGFRTAQPAAGLLDMAAISNRTIDYVQRCPALDQRAPFRSRRVRLRWTAVPDSGTSTVTFSLVSDTLRTVEVRGTDAEPAALARLCEDLALHDWLLSTLLDLTARARLGNSDTALERVRPAIDHLLHLWMPAARIEPELTPLWQLLEESPGFSRQWQSLISRIRDQMMLATLATGGAAPN